MSNSTELIELINKDCKSFFQHSFFRLEKYSIQSHNSLFYRTQGTSTAINRIKSDSEEIKVLPWFDDIWFFMELRLIGGNTFISISIFQGMESDPTKQQLFRAEWDDYNNQSDMHPQPHWHITSGHSIQENFKEYAAKNAENNSFATFERESTKSIDIKKMHFAMNGNWQNDGNHAHPIDDNIKIVRWLQGLLSHIRFEIEYVK